VIDATKISDSAKSPVVFADGVSHLGWLLFVLKNLCFRWLLWLLSADGLNLLPMAESVIVCLCYDDFDARAYDSEVKGQDYPEETY
jgi:hypothetical protein